MPATPTLGWQIAPDYDHDGSEEHSESTTTDSEDEIAQGEEQEEAGGQQDIEKSETQHDNVTVGSATRPTTLQKGRTKSCRKEEPHPPVGFWHWKMVRAAYFFS